MLSLGVRKKKLKEEEEGNRRQAIMRLWKTSLIEREIFVVCLLVFGASISTIVSAQDAVHFALTSSLASSRTILLDSNSYAGAPYTVQIGGRTFSALPPGLAFFTFLPVSLGQFLTPQAPSASGVYIATYFSCIFGALAVVLFYKTARMFGSTRDSALLSIVFAFGTNLWIYSRIYMPEALTTCLVLASVYCVLRAQYKTKTLRKEEGGEEFAPIPSGKKKKSFTGIGKAAAGFTLLSGLLLGVAVFVDNVAIFLIVPIFLYLVIGISSFPRRSIKAVCIASFLIGSLVGFIPVWLYDIATTGSAFDSPYGNPFIGGVWPSSYSFNLVGHGLYEILLSPGSGLLFFTPFVFVAFIGIYYFTREIFGESIFFLGLFFSILIPISLIGDSTYFLHNTVGPSEIIIATPFILLPAMGVLKKKAKEKIGLVSLSSYLLAASSIAMTGIIVLTDPVLGPASELSGAGGSSPLITTNIPLFVEQSFLTWWSFFDDPVVYAILVLIFPILILSYWMFVKTKLRREPRTG
jgi:hypothetical protein